MDDNILFKLLRENADAIIAEQKRAREARLGKPAMIKRDVLNHYKEFSTILTDAGFEDKSSVSDTSEGLNGLFEANSKVTISGDKIKSFFDSAFDGVEDFTISVYGDDTDGCLTVDFMYPDGVIRGD